MFALSLSDVDRRVFSLAWPSIISEVSTPLLSIVDSLVVGHLPDAADLGGVALATAVFNPLLFVFGFLRMGTGGTIAQAYGAKDGSEVLCGGIRGMSIAIAIGVVLCLLQRPIAESAFALIGNGDSAVAEKASSYFSARIVGAPAALSNFCVKAWLIGMQCPGQALVANLILNLSNAFFCVLFAWIFDFGVTGVGYATALANYISLVVGLLQMTEVSRRNPWIVQAMEHINWGTIFEKSKLMKFLHLNGNIFIRSMCMLFITTDFTALSAGLGSIALAANNLLMQLQMLISFGADGFGNAVEAVIGEAFGLKDRCLAREAFISALRWSAVLALGYSVLFISFGQWILKSLTSHEEVVHYGVDYLWWQWIAPPLSVIAYIMDGVFVGATRSLEMRNATFLAMLVFVVVGHVSRDSNNALWMAYLIHLVVRGAFLLWSYPHVEALLGTGSADESGLKSALLPGRQGIDEP